MPVRQLITWHHVTEMEFFNHAEPDYDHIMYYDNGGIGWATYLYGSDALMIKCKNELPYRLSGIAWATTVRHIAYDEVRKAKYFPIFFITLTQEEKTYVEIVLRDILSEVGEI